jgi:hypothetical protein
MNSRYTTLLENDSLYSLLRNFNNNKNFIIFIKSTAFGYTMIHCMFSVILRSIKNISHLVLLYDVNHKVVCPPAYIGYSFLC